MGEQSAITAKEMGIKRVDKAELAVASHCNMSDAYDRGFFDDLITIPGEFLVFDDGYRRRSHSYHDVGRAARAFAATFLPSMHLPQAEGLTLTPDAIWIADEGAGRKGSLSKYACK